jgi:ABC-type transport system involved in cytochrome c biogenesis permease subunit
LKLLAMAPLALFWARIALSFYLVGTAAAIFALLRKHDWPFRATRVALIVGFLFQFVSLFEAGFAAHHFPITQFSEATSLLAFVIVGFFLLTGRASSPRALGSIIVPVVFLLLFAAIYGPHGAAREHDLPVGPVLGNRWVYVHAGLVLLGYAALVLAFAAEVLYLIHEHELKSHPPRQRILRLLPPLDTLERLSSRAVLIGFPLLTVGLLIGIHIATADWGTVGFADPKIAIALLTWAMYLVLLFSRWTVGLRGRRAAFATIACVLVAALGWLSSGFSGLHHYLTR